MYCTNCGKEIHDEAKICIHCGVLVDDGQGLVTLSQSGTVVDNAAPVIPQEDKFNWGFFVLGFLIPIVGLILFFIYSGRMPKKAKGGLIGGVVGMIFWFLLSAAKTIGTFLVVTAIPAIAAAIGAIATFVVGAVVAIAPIILQFLKFFTESGVIQF